VSHSGDGDEYHMEECGLIYEMEISAVMRAFGQR
jgi:hypothetical protein